MSWLTDLTSRAENILNKIDQSAASSFQQGSSNDEPTSRIGEISIKQIVEDKPINVPQTSTTKPKSPHSPMAVSKPHSPTAPVKKSTVNNVKKSLPNSKDHLTDQSNLMRSSSTPSLKKQDDMLFEFLNSNNPVPTKGHVRNLSGPKSSTPKPPPNLLSKSLSNSSEALNNAPLISSGSKSADILNEIKLDNTSTEQFDRIEISEKPPENINSIDVNGESGDIISVDVADSRLSNLELENKLLKNELHSLNEELSSTLTKLKEYKEEAEKYKLRYENRRNQQNEDYDRIKTEFESREADLNEALKAKDSQLAVLRVRIQDTDLQLEQKTNLLEEIQQQNDQILKDHTDASGIQNVALENLKTKIEELEKRLSEETKDKESLKAELMKCESRLADNQVEYSESIKLLQTKHQEEKEKYREFEHKLKSAQDTSASSQKELSDYKEKAARILQAKEKLITSLKQGTNSTDLPPMLISELEELKHEKSMLYDDLHKTKFELEQLKSEYSDLEIVHNHDVEENNERIENLKVVLHEEESKRKHAEDDMKRYMQELHMSRDDLQKMKKQNYSQTQQFESEMNRLQHKLNAKVNTSSSQEELENRIRSLTDSLIQKQTVVEELSTEKNSLVLQLERLERQYLDVQNSLTRRKKDPNQEDPEDPDASRLQPMASIMPRQITQNTRWKKTVNDLDKFSVRLGVFLRRYPIARLMVIGYMILLHLWSTFVLLTYTPEVHDDHACAPPK